MTPPATFQSQQPSTSKPGRKPKRTGEADESGKKPKKVNSEIRKQQNRIASRNYREKRKRKLQYLQQLLKDGNSSDQTGHSSEYDEDPRARSVSAEYHMPGPSSGSLVFSSTSSLNSWGSSHPGVIDPSLATTTAPFDNHLLATTQSYPSFEPTWDAQMYEPPAQINMPSAWNMNSWTPNLNFNSPPATSRPERFQFTPPPAHPEYEQLPTPPQQPRELAPSPDMFVLGAYRPNTRRPPNQGSQFPNYMMNQQRPLLQRRVYI